MRIIYMGTPDFAVGPLEALIGAGHDIVCVVTQPDRVSGRGRKETPSPVKEAALRHGLTVLQPERIRDEEAVTALREYQADVGVVAAFGQILPEEVLNMPAHGCLNIHASLLPKHRGAAPIQAAILAGDSETGITIMQMDKGLDTGDILLQRKLGISDEDTGGSLFDKLSALGAEAVVQAVSMLEEGSLEAIPQDDTLATYSAKITKSSGRIDWEEDAEGICRRIRAFTPWPGTFTKVNEPELKILKAEVLNGDPGAYPGGDTPGTVLSADKDGIRVLTGDGVLKVTEVQAAGRKRMTAGEYLRGLREDITGVVLG